MVVVLAALQVAVVSKNLKLIADGKEPSVKVIVIHVRF